MTTKLPIAVSALITLAAAGCFDASEQGPSLIGLAELSSEAIVLTCEGASEGMARYVHLSLPIAIGYGHGPGDCQRLSPTLIITRDGRPPDSEYRGGGTHETLFDGEGCDSTASAASLVPDAGGPMVFAFDDGAAHAEIEIVLPPLERFALVSPASGRARPGETLEVQVPGSFFAERDLPPLKLRPPTAGVFNLSEDAIAFDEGIFVRAGTDPTLYTNWKTGDLGVSAVADDRTATLQVIVPDDLTPGDYDLYLPFLRDAWYVPLPTARCDGFASCTATTRDNLGALGPTALTIE